VSTCPHCHRSLTDVAQRGPGATTEHDLSQQLCPHCGRSVAGGPLPHEQNAGQLTVDSQTPTLVSDAAPPGKGARTIASHADMARTIDSADFSAPPSDSGLAQTLDSTDVLPEGNDSRLMPTIESGDHLPPQGSGSSVTIEHNSRAGGSSDIAPTLDSSIVVQVRSDSAAAEGGGSSDERLSSGDDIDRRLRQVWGSQVASSRPQMTMRVSNAGEEGFEENTTLIIRQRKLRQASDAGPVTMADYDLLGVLGEGGMGVVYNARQASIDREVAVKMLKPEITASSAHRRKFLSEVAVTGELDHPNIVPIYDLGENADGALFYSMKKVTGTPWSKVIRRTPLLENLTILMKVADAVAFAHARGVVHRDLKPENVMLGEFGEVLVLDWGLAVATDGHRPTPNVSTLFNIAGSPAYMAPELVFGPMEAIGRHSDIYLLGAILYECISGRPPHGGKSAKDCLKNAARNHIVPTEKRGELVDIALKAMHTNSAQRYPTVQAFQQAIRDYQAHSESIVLCERAEVELAKAAESHDYRDFSRALFAFEEALQLWPGNTNARSGVSRAKLQYATGALAKSDFDLGLSLIDPEDASHDAVHKQLAEAKAERDARQHRLARARRTMAALAALVFLTVSVGVVVASYLAYAARTSELKAIASAEIAKREEKRARESETQAIASELKAKDSESKARTSEGKARESEAKAKESEVKAKESEAKAVANEGLAKTEAERARKAEKEAKQRREEAVASAYTALIAMAAARIDENAFDQARLALAQCDEKLRGWEWRRLMHVVEQGDVTQFNALSRSEALAVNAGGTLIATGGQDGIVRLWDRARRVLVAERDFGKPTGRITALDFHPRDDRWLIVGTSDGPQTLIAWNRASGEVRTPAVEHRHAGGVVQVTFAADGESLLTASLDRTARLWSWETLVPRILAGHTGTVWSAALSADGKLVATASEDGTVRIWDAASGEQRRSLGQRIPFTQHHGAVHAVIFLPTPQAVLPGSAPAADTEVSYLLASAGYDKRVLLWQPDELVPFDFQGLVADRPVPESDYQELSGHTAAVRTLAVSADGVHLASAASDHTIRVWQAQDSGVARRGALVKELRGHAGPVYAATFAAGDANAIVSTGYDDRVRLWSIDQYDEEQRMPGLALRGHVGPVLSARFSPKGESIVTASLDRTARTWNTKTGGEVRVLREGHSYLASRAIFFPKSRRLLTSGGDGTVRIWDLDRQAELRVFDRTGYRAAAAISPDERMILTGSSDLVAEGARPHGAILSSAETGEPLHPLVGSHKAPVTCVAFSPAAERPLALTGDDNGVFQLWNSATGEPVGPRIDQHASPIVAAEFAADGQSLVTADAGGHAFRWSIIDPAAIEKRHVYPHPAGIQSLALTHDGHLLTGGTDGRLRLFEADGTEPLWIADGLASKPGFFVSAEAPAQENIVAVSVGWDAAKGVAVVVAVDALRRPLMEGAGGEVDEEFVRLFELDFAKGAFGEVSRGAGADAHPCLIDLNAHGAVGWSAAIAADASRIVTVGRDEARLWGRDGNELAAFRPHQDLTFAEYSHDGKFIATASLDSSVRVWDAVSGQARLTLDEHSAGPLGGHEKPVTCAVFSPDDKHVFTGSEDGTVRKWNLETMRVDQVITVIDSQGGVSGVTRIVLPRDGQTLFTVSRSGEGAVWSLADTSQPLRRLIGHTGEILDLCLSGDEKWIVTASADNTARIWDASTGTVLLKLAGHASEVTSVAILADGPSLRVLTGSSDKTAKLWAVSGLGEPAVQADGAQTGEKAGTTPKAQELLSLKGHTRELTSVAFAPDGRAALTTARDGLTILWPAIAPPAAAAVTTAAR
jgi:WD40 repeat protein/serine/threonine protein kinase